MKSLILAGSLAIVFLSCNDNGEAENASKLDSSGHGSHQSDTSSALNQAADTTGMAGKSMMSMMTAMMDNMKAIKSTGNPDNDFAALMKAHHLGAIEMAQMEVAKGNDAQVRQMAQKMIDDQQKEVAEFNTFLSGHAAHGGGEAYFKEAMGIMNNMKMDGDHNGTVDKQFVQMMIPHHQTAIDMSKAYLKSGAHEAKLKTMATNIVSSQQKEIQDLQAWLAKNK